jgi:hypothetical protein
MGVVQVVVKHNLRWMLVSVLIFAFASGILSNASSLSQWYSKTLTAEFLDVTRVDFVVEQTGLPDKVADVHGTIPRLQEVTGVVTELMVCPAFYTRVEISKTDTTMSSFTIAHASNGTRLILDLMYLCGYLGLEQLIPESDLQASYPKRGEAVVSKVLAELLDIRVGDNFTLETPSNPLTFRVSGMTELSWFDIDEKIRKPDSPVQTSPLVPPLDQMQFVQTVSGDLWLNLTRLPAIWTNWFAVISPDDAADLFGRDWILQTPMSSISHFVYTSRDSLVEPLNIDKTVVNLQQARDRIELTASEAPASVKSDILQLFETAATEVDLFAVIAGGFMLAAFPLYWFVASPITNMFVERKRKEIILLRTKGLSLRGVSIAYTTLIVLSAVIGGVLGAMLQANILQILAALHLIGSQYASVSGRIGFMLPDVSSLLLYVVVSLVLAAVSVRRVTKSVGQFEPVEADRLRGNPEKASDHVGKLTLLLLCLGLVKLFLQFAGWNSTVYFRYPPSNPFLSMGLTLFAAVDNYALTPLAPVFVGYGFAKLISANSSKIGVLLHPFSLLAGLRKRKISFRILTSDMWRSAASLTLLTLVLSYGISSYVTYGTITQHTSNLEEEFTGADIRIDCLPNATSKVEETLKSIPENFNYTRIDVLMSFFETDTDLGKVEGFQPVIAIDPETYVDVAYLENAPELRAALANLTFGHIIGLESAQWMNAQSGAVITSGSFPKAAVSKEWSEIRWYPGLQFNETVEFSVDKWFNISVPATVESTETLQVKAPLEDLVEHYYSASQVLWYYGAGEYLADALLPHTSQGALFDFAGFIMRQDNESDIKHDQIKSIFVLRPQSESETGNVVAALRDNLTGQSLIISRSEAITVLRTSYPRLAVGLDFTQINCILITVASLGGLVAIAAIAATGRKTVLSLLRIKGSSRKDCVALFLPETALILFLAGLLGTVMGLLLGTAFVNSIADLIPPLFTGSSVHMFLAPAVWYFTATALAVFAVVQITSTAASSTIDTGAV